MVSSESLHLLIHAHIQIWRAKVSWRHALILIWLVLCVLLSNKKIVLENLTDFAPLLSLVDLEGLNRLVIWCRNIVASIDVALDALVGGGRLLLFREKVCIAWSGGCGYALGYETGFCFLVDALILDSNVRRRFLDSVSWWDYLRLFR